ncbi:MAG: N-formylglutamate deformylase [Burkholderiaceae bacterium]|nr:N-formylglutamate deformylase [Burkholderiaceae bacterium]
MQQPTGSVGASASEPQVFRCRRGNSRLVVSMPHVGTEIPSALAAGMTPEALQLADTDWHLPLVYDLEGLDATILVARCSRLVIDLNRPPDDESLYPGQDTTGLLPVDTFRREPVYRGEPPDAAERTRRLDAYWRPYHEALAAELARLRRLHEHVVLWDAHSIASELPRFFSGRLNDLNFGTADGRSCDPGLIAAVLEPVARQQQYTWVLDGRFKGGYITRSFGNPAAGIHAVQLEMTQRTYMEEQAPFRLRPDLCERLSPLLRQCLAAAAAWPGPGRGPAER